MIPAGIGAAIGLVAAWLGFAYRDAMLTNLTKSLADLAQDIGDALQNLQRSLDSLAMSSTTEVAID